MKRSLLVKHCALSTTLALSLQRDASESMWWKIIDCKQVSVAQYDPDSLEAEVSILGQFVLSEPRTFEGHV